MFDSTKKTVELSKEKYAYIDVGNGETVVMIHGNMSSGVHYAPLIQRLKNQYRVVAPDLRGFGDTSYNRPFDSMEQLADDLKEFLDAIKVDGAHFVCWSAGCCVALKFAAKYPKAVKSIFAIEGGSHKGYPIFKKDKSFSSIYGAAYASKEEMSQDPVQVAPVVMMLKNKDAAQMSALWDSVIYTCKKPTKEDNQVYIEETLKQRCLVDLDWALANVNMSDRANAYVKGDNTISDVTCPCAFTTADKDLSVPDWMVMENVNAIKNSKLILYKDCGHSPLVDCPDRLAQDITQFIKSVE